MLPISFLFSSIVVVVTAKVELSALLSLESELSITVTINPNIKSIKRSIKFKFKHSTLFFHTRRPRTERSSRECRVEMKKIEKGKKNIYSLQHRERQSEE